MTTQTLDFPRSVYKSVLYNAMACHGIIVTRISLLTFLVMERVFTVAGSCFQGVRESSALASASLPRALADIYTQISHVWLVTAKNKLFICQNFLFLIKYHKKGLRTLSTQKSPVYQRSIASMISIFFACFQMYYLILADFVRYGIGPHLLIVIMMEHQMLKFNI